MTTTFKEIEYKYAASGIPLTEFESVAKTSDCTGIVVASGYDHFYEDAKNKASFWRHRVGGDINQLTLKRKLIDANNYVRTEHNVNLAPDTSPEVIRGFLKEIGAKYNTSIFKNAFIYQFPKHIFVYYVVYDTQMKELGRFVEIEMSESYPWKSEAEAISEMQSLERSLKVLGITAQARLKRSLYEMFAKGE